MQSDVFSSLVYNWMDVQVGEAGGGGGGLIREHLLSRDQKKGVLGQQA